jgi:predicted enzyme related to lactoylglutathione lyase
VSDADQATEAIRAAGGQVIAAPSDIAVGRLAVVADPFGNVLVLLDLSKGRYVTDATGRVTGVTPS